jgi:hypothetical protein
VGLTFWFALTSVALGQQQSEAQTNNGSPQRATESTTVHSYAAGNVTGSKVVRTRTESGGREVVTEAIEVPGTDGRFEINSKTTTETVGIGSDSVKAKRETFAKDLQGGLTLIETTDTDQQKFPDGTIRTINNTSVPDLNGHLVLSSREVEETKPTSRDVQETETLFSLPGINEPLIETERVRQTERRSSPYLIQTDSQRDVRDVNGLWQTTEMRSQALRTIGPAEVLEEETVRSLDGNGRLTLSERTITRRSNNNGSDQVVIEVYSTEIPGLARGPGSPLELEERIRVTTTPTVNGGSQTISETEARIPGVANGPLQVIARTVETVWQIRPGLKETQRQIFGRDGNGRLVPIKDEREETEGK